MHTTSERGYAVIRSFEGRSLKAYRDEAGVWTIGYGNTNYDSDVLGFEIKAGVMITPEQAEQLLRAAVTRRYEPAVNSHMGADVTQPAFDAGGSFHYNTGAIGRASWVQSYVAKNLPAVHSQLMQWNRAGGNELAGLTRRRNREWLMISANDYGPEGATAPVDMTTGKPVAGSPPAQPAPPEASKPPSLGGTPSVVGPAPSAHPWLDRMDAILGLYEYPGAANNPAIIEMAVVCGGDIARSYKQDATAWCALTVNFCLISTGFKGTGTLWALDFRKLGTRLSGPAVGAIATKTRNGGGHVFIVRGRTADGRIVGVGGNQADMVCDEEFDPAACQYNWPAGSTPPTSYGTGALPIVSVRPHAHKDYGKDYIDHIALQGTVVPPNLTDTPGMLQPGSRGDEVRDLQLALKAAGYGNLDGTGVYGPNTAAAVRAFQHAHPQLQVTGIADKATRAALKRDSDMRAAAKKTAAKGAGTGSVAGAADSMTSHVHWWLYAGIGVVVAGALCYVAWTYRDELRGFINSFRRTK